jgi:putative ABC transport system permease protein
MQSVRARIPELAVLKTYGFSNTAVMSLVLAESVILCGVAAAIGIGIAAVISPPIYRQFGAGGLNLPLAVVAIGIGLASSARRCRPCVRSGSASSTRSRGADQNQET